MKRELITAFDKVAESVPEGLKPYLAPFDLLYRRFTHKLSKGMGSRVEKLPQGPEIRVSPESVVEPLAARGKWETQYMKQFEDSIENGDSIVDIGAHVGVFTLVAAEVAGPNGTVHSFEPVPRNTDRLRENCALNDYNHVTISELALSNSKGTAEMQINEGNYAEAGLGTPWSKVKDGTDVQTLNVTVETQLLDDWMCRSELENVDVIKIDVDGAEQWVMEGGSSTLKENDLTLFVEITPELVRDQGGSVEEIVGIILNTGFKRMKIEGSSSWINIRHYTPPDLAQEIIPDSTNYIFDKRDK